MKPQNRAISIVIFIILKKFEKVSKILQSAFSSKNVYPGIKSQQNGNASSEERNSLVGLTHPARSLPGKIDRINYDEKSRSPFVPITAFRNSQN